MSFWEQIEQFDPHTADPHFCWVLLQMERERYVRIQGGKIIPTPKLEEVSPQAILNRHASQYQCQAAKAILVSESNALLTIRDGAFELTEMGKDAALDLMIAEAEQGGQGRSTARVGRNDLCPCGSGRKYKKCCLRKQNDTDELTKHAIWVEGAAHQLVAKGLLEVPITITPKGIEAYNELIASGWKPVPEIVESYLIYKGVSEATLDDALTLFMALAYGAVE